MTGASGLCHLGCLSAQGIPPGGLQTTLENTLPAQIGHLSQTFPLPCKSAFLEESLKAAASSQRLQGGRVSSLRSSCRADLCSPLPLAGLESSQRSPIRRQPLSSGCLETGSAALDTQYLLGLLPPERRRVLPALPLNRSWLAAVSPRAAGDVLLAHEILTPSTVSFSHSGAKRRVAFGPEAQAGIHQQPDHCAAPYQLAERTPGLRPRPRPLPLFGWGADFSSPTWSLNQARLAWRRPQPENATRRGEPLTFVIEGPVKVEAARVEARGQFDEVPAPGVACPGKAREGHHLLGAAGQKPPVHAAVVCKQKGRQAGGELGTEAPCPCSLGLAVPSGWAPLPCT